MIHLNLKSFFIAFVILFYGSAYAQPIQKKLAASRTSQSIKIDGVLDDEAWKLAETATDFIELRPVPGGKEKKGRATEVKILYDDEAIYVHARMNEPDADSIARQIVPRDQVGNADFIGVVFDTYFDKINGNGFYVTAAGSQYDAKYSQTGNEDDNWNAVWFSEVKIDKTGWSAEMKIPYSALRFSNKDVQTWGVNFTRRRQKFNFQSFWNNVDPNVSGFINQEGQLTNIENIKAPVRLSFSPYISNITNHYQYNNGLVKNLTSKFNGGVDVKYGINDAFTLDMTLVPDFGQVQSDNKILNLSPFEVRFNERRQFFTEGTEMFNKGDLFYSRRVGLEPVFKYPKAGNEKTISEPIGSKLINATKISGRTAKGLGIGVFNAVTNQMFATVKDTLTGIERSVESQPLVNYSIIVFDQSLKNNSSVTFLNANTLRKGSAYDANVSAILFRLNDKKNKYFISGEGKFSYLTPDGSNSAKCGINYKVGFGKQSGKFNWDIRQQLSDSKYNPSDLGFFTNNNFLDHRVGLRYNIYKPSKWFNQFESWVDVFYSERLTQRAYQSLGVYPGVWFQFKNFWTSNINLNFDAEGNDFYEARSNGKVFKSPANYSFNVNFRTNRSKRFHTGAFLEGQKTSLLNGRGWGMGTWQTFRLTDRFSLNTEFSTTPRFNSVGWVDNYKEPITDKSYTIFSTFNRQTVESVFSTNYTFSPRMGISLRARHYWSERKNKLFYALNDDGSLSGYDMYTKNKNQNYNTFNIDMIYTWQFAPGSELSVAYKDAGENFGNVLQKNYGRNIGSTLSSPLNNSLSVKVLYYVDYLDIKRKMKRF